jgi:hypothetical protein
MDFNRITDAVIAACIEVHRALGPGLLVVEECVVVEVKLVQQLDPIHEAQLLTYLRLGGWKLGLLINFNVPLLKDGIKRRVNNL